MDKYEVQTYTLCDGWINTWTDEDENPIVFDNLEAAKKELLDHFKDLQESVENRLLTDYASMDHRLYNKQSGFSLMFTPEHDVYNDEIILVTFNGNLGE
jgi:hypothetical protein